MSSCHYFALLRLLWVL